MGDDKRYVLNPSVSFGDEGDDGAVLFNPDTDDVVLINSTGKTIWQFIGDPQTQAQISAHLMDVFEGGTEVQVGEDVEAFIINLLPDFVQEMDS